MNEADCLAYDPFQGDETDIRELSDKFVTTRKPHKCNICWDEVPPGQRARAKTEVNREDQQTKTFYFCVSCCEAMASSWTDECEAIDARTSIGMSRARQK
jgi:hypothetical protein